MKRYQKLLSIVFTVMLLVSTFLTPVSTYAATLSNNDENDNNIESVENDQDEGSEVEENSEENSEEDEANTETSEEDETEDTDNKVTDDEEDTSEEVEMQAEKKTENKSEENVSEDNNAEVNAIAVEEDLVAGDIFVTVPEEADVFIGKKVKHFIKFTEEESVEEAVINGDGTKTVTYKLSANGSYNYRVSAPGKVTTVGKFIAKADFHDIEITEDDLELYDPKEILNQGTYLEGNIYLNINEQNHLKLENNETFKLLPMRSWQALIEGIENYYFEPDFHYEVISGDDVISISPDGPGSYAEIEALKEGTAIVKVTYDALKVDGSGYLDENGAFSAIWPENVGLFVVTVGNNDTNIDTGIESNKERNIKSDTNLQQGVFDSEIDSVYYLNGEQGAEYTFTPTENTDVEVMRPSINGSTVSYNDFSNENVKKNEDGSFTILLTEGRNIVKVFNGDNAEYHVMTARPLDVNVENLTNENEEVVAGDEVKVTFKGLSFPANKLAGIYNFQGQLVFGNTADEEEFKGDRRQYNMATQANTLQFTVPENLEDGYSLTDGHIDLSFYGSPIGSHHNLNAETGAAPNLNAVPAQGSYSIFPDIEIIPSEEVVDKSGLDEIIEEAKDIDVDELTPTSQEVLTNSITAAETVFENDEASQEEVDAAIVALEDVLDGLKTLADTSELEALLSKMKAINVDELTPSSKELLADVINEAETTLEDLEVSQETVDEVVVLIKQTINKIKDLADTTELDKLLKEAKDIDVDELTPASQEALAEVISEAELIIKNQEASQEVVDEAVEALENVLASLEKRVDYTKLKAAIKSAKNIKTDDLTPSSKKALKQVIIDAEAIVDSSKASQEEVNKAIKSIEEISSSLKTLADKSVLKDTIDTAEELDLSDEKDKVKKDLEKALNAAKEIYEDLEASQTKVDEATEKLSEAISNLNSRAPPVEVNVRVEAHDKTVLSLSKVEVDAFDLREYTHSSTAVEDTSPRAVHAIIQALDEETDLDLKDPEQFGIASDGNYITSIDGNGEFTGGPLSGWMYTVNNELAPVGVRDFEIKDDDSIVLFYVENYMDSTFSWFDQEKYEVEPNEALNITLTGVLDCFLNYDEEICGSGSPVANSKIIDGATLLVNDEPYLVDGEPLIFGEDGKTEISFSEIGEYHLSAVRKNENDEINLVRPFALVEVTEKEVETPEKPETPDTEDTDNTEDPDDSEDTEDNNDSEEQEDTRAPLISVNDLTDGQTVYQRELSFTASAKDDVDGKVDVKVSLNDDVIKAEKDNKFVLNLKEGKNTIQISAKDAAGNESIEKYTITYEKLVVNKDADKAIDDLVKYILDKGVTSEWEAIGLAQAGIDVPKAYLDVLEGNIEAEITQGLDNGRFKITDAERLALATLAVGADPTNIYGHNLMELIYNSPDREMYDGTKEDTMTFQGNNGLAFALITLDAKDFEVPEDAKWTRDKLVKELLNNQLSNGSWPLNNSGMDAASIDITAMVITALKPYSNDDKVKNAIQNAVQFLSKAQEKSGGFDGGGFVGGITSEAASQVMIGLAANGISPESDQFTKDASLLQHLLSFQNKDGGFKHLLDSDKSDIMASEQAIQALVAYKNLELGRDSIYSFNSVFKEVDRKSEAINFETERIADENMLVGEEKVIQKGKKGSENTITEAEFNFKGEQVPGTEVVRTEVVDPVNKIIAYGTAVKAELDKPIVLDKADSQVVYFGDSDAKVKINQAVAEGTQVIVKDVSKDTTVKASEKLEIAGDVFEIKILTANGEPIEGSYTLTLSYDNDTYEANEVDIYYYNEKTGEWEKMNGQVDSQNGLITVEVTHFSTYGVLANVTDEETDENTSNEEGSEENATDKDKDKDADKENGSDDSQLPPKEDEQGDGNKTSAQDNADGSSDLSQSDKNEGAADSNDDTLPKTATNSYNIMLFGLILILLGGMYIAIRKAKEN